MTSKNSQKRATEVLSAGPALNVAELSGASAKSRHPAHLRPGPGPDRVSLSGSRKEALMRKWRQATEHCGVGRKGRRRPETRRGLQWEELSEIMRSRLQPGAGVSSWPLAA